MQTAETQQIIDAPATLPDPGIHEGVSFEDYRAWPALSKTTLEWGAKESILHLKAAVDGKLTKPDTDALAFGRALHTRLLEPARFKDEYIVVPDFASDPVFALYANPRGTKEYKRRVETFREIHSDRTFLERDDADTIEAMAASVFAHPGVAMLREAGGCEVSITWQHSTGIRLKGRLDKFTRFQGLPTIIDIKGVRSCEPDALSKQINDLGWHRQGAMYIDGVHALTGEWADFILICVEKTYPYAVSVQQVAERSIALGRRQLLGVLQRWAHAERTGVYDAFGDDIGQIDVPEWQLRRDKQAEELA